MTKRERIALAVILALAALVRLWRLDLMEFKSDEAQACQLALQIAAHEHFPLTGLQASVGVPNPPLFVYLLALPLGLSADPVAAAAAIACANVAAVWICFLVGRRYFSAWSGLAAAALYALSPWAVVFSRKIWAQDLLPVFAGLFLLEAHAFIVERRPRALAGMIALAAAATQLHFSAFILGGVIAYLAIAGRETVRVRPLLAGLAIAGLLYAPYLCYLARSHGSDFANLGTRRAAWDAIVPAAKRLALALRYPFSVSGADGIDSLVGAQPAWAWPLALAAGLGGLGGLAWLCRRDRGTGRFHARVALLLWFALPTAALIATGVAPFIHYFIILYPLPFLGLAAALEPLGRRWPAASRAVLGLCLAAYAWLDLGVYRAVSGQGGAPADYGVAYRHKAAAADYILRENRGRPYLVWYGFNPNSQLPFEYRLLLAWENPERGRPLAPETPTSAYAIFDHFHSRLTAQGEAATRSLPQRAFGPLTVYAVPLPP
ncbi:MAG TPA: glycosyltransferase family 39 protein [Opitutaceae bacterium]|nr:glycosyltransferase family 39 protein [Opitutaceae bacterium]